MEFRMTRRVAILVNFIRRKRITRMYNIKFKRLSKKKFGRGIQINQNMTFCVKVCYGQKKSYGLRDYPTIKRDYH